MIKSKYKQKINFNYNPDIDKNDITEKNKIKDDIVEFLKTIGEVKASKFLENELLNPKKVSAQDMDEDFLRELIKLSKTNKSILDVLKRIQEDMIDEQDTSIKQYKMSESKSKGRDMQYIPDDEDEDSSGFSLPFGFGRNRYNKKKERKLKEKLDRQRLDEEERRNNKNNKTNKEILDEEEEKRKQKIIDENNKKNNTSSNSSNGTSETKPNENKPDSNGSSETKPNETKTPEQLKKEEDAIKKAEKDAKKIEKQTIKMTERAAVRATEAGVAATGAGAPGATLAFLATETVFAIQSLYDGYKDAAEIAGKDEKDLTTGDQVKAAVSQLVADTLLNTLDEKNAYKGLDKLTNIKVPNVNDILNTEIPNIDDALNKIITFDELSKKTGDAVDATKNYIGDKVSEGIAAFKKYNNAPVHYYGKDTKDLTLDDSAATGVDTTQYDEKGNVIKHTVDKLKELNNSPVNYGKNVPNLITEDVLLTGEYSDYKKDIAVKQEEIRQKKEKFNEEAKKINDEYDKNTIKANYRFEKGDTTGSVLELLHAKAQKMSDLNAAKYGEKDVGSSILEFISGGMVHTRDWFDTKGKYRISKEEIDKNVKAKNQSDNSFLIQNKRNPMVPFVADENEEKVNTLIKRGVLSRDAYSIISISNLNEIKKLTMVELINLFYRDDLSEESKQQLAEILTKKQKQVVVKPEDLMPVKSNETIVFDDQDILAYSVLTSKNDLDKFLAENPFTDENVEKIEKIINGKKVTTIKYVNEELNQKYIKLKEQYDADYKRYAENRTNQIKQLQDYVEVEGQVMSKEEFNAFTQAKNKDGSLSAASFVETAINTQASGRVEDLIAKYKNIAIPSDQIPLIDRIKGAEGFTPIAKPDAGGMAIGYGHQIVKGEEGLLTARITQEQAAAMLAAELNGHYIPAAERIPGYDKAPKKVQNALIDMTYNMGTAWYNKWPNLVKDLQAQNYAAVAENIRHSKYARDVKGRAFINANIFDEAEKNKNSNNSSNKTDNTSTINTKNVSSSTTSPETQNSNSGTNSQPPAAKLNSSDAVDSKSGTENTVNQNSASLIETTKNNGTSVNVASVTPIINNSNSNNKNNANNNSNQASNQSLSGSFQTSA